MDGAVPMLSRVPPVSCSDFVDAAVSAAPFVDGVHEPPQDVLSLSEIKQEQTVKDGGQGKEKSGTS